MTVLSGVDMGGPRASFRGARSRFGSVTIDRFADGAGSVPPPDTTAPTITIVSPTPGIPAGRPGGFPSSLAQAKATPVVILIEDVAPGLQYICVVVRFGSDSNATEEVVYRRGAFRGLYKSLSVATVTAHGVQLSILRDGGWPSNANQVSQLVFAADAADKAGNLYA